MTDFPEKSSASIEINAAPEVVWQLVADITRMGEWSPECWKAEWEDGTTGPAVGALFRGYNRAGSTSGSRRASSPTANPELCSRSKFRVRRTS